MSRKPAKLPIPARAPRGVSKVSAQEPAPRGMAALELGSIHIGKRIRRDLGDIDGLARSIESEGLLHPIVVCPDGRLIAGHRRLAAIKQLGWAQVPVHVVDLNETTRGEVAENTVRKDFLPTEIEAIRRMYEASEKAAAKERQREHGGTAPGKQSRNVSGSDGGEVRNKIGAIANVSGRTVEKIAAVVEAAEAEPERFGHLVAEMDRTGKVTGAYRKLKQRQDEERVLGLVPIEGRFRTLVIDPPWDYEWLSLAGRAAPGYATMKHEELLALDVGAWAHEDCHLYLWTTNNFMMRAGELMARWGFAYKTLLTWNKSEIGLGSYFRNSTEHVLFGVRGEVGTRPAAHSIGTQFEGPIGEHSEKPESFYQIVRAASYPPYGEAFQIKLRDDFRTLFAAAGEKAIRADR